MSLIWYILNTFIKGKWLISCSITHTVVFGNLCVIMLIGLFALKLTVLTDTPIKQVTPT